MAERNELAFVIRTEGGQHHLSAHYADGYPAPSDHSAEALAIKPLVRMEVVENS